MLGSALRRVRVNCLTPRVRTWHDVCTSGRLGDPSAMSAPAVLRTYLRLLHERPVTIAVAGTAFAAAAGDLLAQAAHATGLNFDSDDFSGHTNPWSAMAAMLNRPPLAEGVATEMGPVRTARFAAVVSALVGGIGTLWFRRLMVPFPGWQSDVALRTFLDQLVFAPAVLALVIGSSTLATSWDASYACQRVYQDTLGPLTTMWSIWGGGVAFSYLMVPTPWQPVFAVGLGAVWCTCVSLRVHRPTAYRVQVGQHVEPYLRDSRELS